METKAILSGLGTLRRGVAIAAAAVILGSAAPALALSRAPNPVPQPALQTALLQHVVWRWNGYRWVWVPGPRYRYYGPPARHWIPGHWVWGPYGRRWIPGHWV